MAATLAANQGFFHENNGKHEKTLILSKSLHPSYQPQPEFFSVCQSVSVKIFAHLSVYWSICLSLRSCLSIKRQESLKKKMRIVIL